MASFASLKAVLFSTCFSVVSSSAFIFFFWFCFFLAFYETSSIDKGTNTTSSSLEQSKAEIKQDQTKQIKALEETTEKQVVPLSMLDVSDTTTPACLAVEAAFVTAPLSITTDWLPVALPACVKMG